MVVFLVFKHSFAEGTATCNCDSEANIGPHQPYRQNVPVQYILVSLLGTSGGSSNHLAMTGMKFPAENEAVEFHRVAKPFSSDPSGKGGYTKIKTKKTKKD